MKTKSALNNAPTQPVQLSFGRLLGLYRAQCLHPRIKPYSRDGGRCRGHTAGVEAVMQECPFHPQQWERLLHFKLLHLFHPRVVPRPDMIHRRTDWWPELMAADHMPAHHTPARRLHGWDQPLRNIASQVRVHEGKRSAGEHNLAPCLPQGLATSRKICTLQQFATHGRRAARESEQPDPSTLLGSLGDRKMPTVIHFTDAGQTDPRPRIWPTRAGSVNWIVDVPVRVRESAPCNPPRQAYNCT